MPGAAALFCRRHDHCAGRRQGPAAGRRAVGGPAGAFGRRQRGLYEGLHRPLGAQAAQAPGGGDALFLFGGRHRQDGGGVPPGAADPPAGPALRRPFDRHGVHRRRDRGLLQRSQGRFQTRPHDRQGAHRPFRRGVPAGREAQDADGGQVGGAAAGFQGYL